MRIVDGKVYLTTREFIENIRKNGLPQGAEYLFSTVVEHTDYAESSHQSSAEGFDTGEKIVQACAFGQGLINSNAAFDASHSPGNSASPNWDELELVDKLYHDTWNLNDDAGYSMDEIADILLTTYAEELDEEIWFDYFDYQPYL